MQDSVVAMIVILLGLALLFGFHSCFDTNNNSYLNQRNSSMFFSPVNSAIVPPVVFRIEETRQDGTLTVSAGMLQAICKKSLAWSKQRESLPELSEERKLFDRIIAIYAFGGYCIDSSHDLTTNPEFPPQPPLNCPVLFYDNNQISSALIGARAGCPSLLLALCGIRRPHRLPNQDANNNNISHSLLSAVLYPTFFCTPGNNELSTMARKREDTVLASTTSGVKTH